MSEIDQVAAALAAAQGELQGLERNRTVNVRTKQGGTYSFEYATLDAVLDHVRGPLSRHGLALIHVLGDNGRTVSTRVIHSSGQSLDGGAIPVLCTDSGPQSYGSALTYAKRYSLCALLCIAAETDDDGNAASGNEIVGASDRQPGHKCPSCGSAVWDNRQENAGTNKPLWKCRNTACTGHFNKKTDQTGPWVSWDEDPFSEKPAEKPAEKKDNVTLLRSALQVAGCKTEEDADLVVRWISEGAYTLQSAKATLEDAGVVHDALLKFTRGGKRLDRALPLAREWESAGQASEAFG